jgi:DNA polymerase type B, organellar and viral
MKVRKRASIRVDGIWDIECAQWDRFVIGVTYHVASGEMRRHISITSLVDTMLGYGGTWWAHNGGAYDILAVAEELRSRGLSMAFSMSGSRVSRGVGSGLTLCDSYSLIPMGLERVGDIGGVQAPRLDWPCSCGRSCGGYCSIVVGMSGAKLRQLGDYCTADTECLAAALNRLREHASDHDYDLRGTIGGAAWSTARRWLDLPDQPLASPSWRRVRMAYYGGRVSVFRARATSGRHWDMSSAYPSSLSTAVLPIGEMTEHGAREARALLRRGNPGIYSATVTVPPSHVPPLPWGDGETLSYPVGRVSGTWVLPELEAAIERGAVVDDVAWCVVWSDEAPVFGDVMREWVETRISVGKRTALGDWQRMFCNSLTGKLAESPERTFVSLHPKDVKLCTARSPCTLDTCRCGSYRQLDMWGELYSVPFYRLAPSSYVQWGAYVTALTRIAWLRGAETQGADLVYGDTDSLWTTGDAVPGDVGDELGRWAMKPSWADWECEAPKTYSFIDGSTGECTVRAAGARVSFRQWREGSAHQDRGVLSLVSAATGLGERGNGLFRRAEQKWTLPRRGHHTGWYGDRKLDTYTGLTHAVTCEEIKQRNASGT